MGRFEFTEHTADVGMLVQASSLQDLFYTAAQGFLAAVLENPRDALSHGDRHEQTIQLQAENLEGLYVDWLRELIFRFDAELRIWVPKDPEDIYFEMGPDRARLQARCNCVSVDWAWHQPHMELKAVTYHQLSVAQTAEGWRAQVIFDI